MKIVLSLFQELLKFFMIFLFCFVWLRLVFSLAISLSVSLALTFLIWSAMFLIAWKKNKTIGLKNSEKLKAEQMFLSLALDGNAVEFFFSLAQKKHEKVEKKKTHIVVIHEQEKVKTVLFPHLKMQNLTQNDVTEIYQKVKKEKATKIVICCLAYDTQILPFLENFQEKILLLDEYETYEKLFKTYDCFPQITREFTPKKMTRKDLLAHSFNKKRTKGYLISAIALVFCSFFVSSNIYYCLMASILIIFAIISQFNPRFNRIEAQEIL